MQVGLGTQEGDAGLPGVVVCKREGDGKCKVALFIALDRLRQFQTVVAAQGSPEISGDMVEHVCVA